LAEKNNERAAKAFEDVLKVDHADVDAARALIPLVAIRRRRGSRMRTSVSWTSIRSRPRRTPCSASWQCSGRMRPAAVKAFRTVLATNPPDRAAALVDLGEAYLLAKRPTEAKAQALARAGNRTVVRTCPRLAAQRRGWSGAIEILTFTVLGSRFSVRVQGSRWGSVTVRFRFGLK
jgi:hypothetical protein